MKTTRRSAPATSPATSAPAATSTAARKSRARRARRTRASAPAKTVDVMTQLGVAVRRPQAALLGGLVGGVVPWFARTLAHGDLAATWASCRPLAALELAVVLGCCAFSMVSVYKFGLATFGDRRKALGFVAALEGVMLVGHGLTGAVALAMLVLINALGNGCHIALAQDATARRQEADQRRQATRRERRQAARGQVASAADAAGADVGIDGVRAAVGVAMVRVPASRLGDGAVDADATYIN